MVHRIDTSTAVSSLPITSSATGQPGFFTNGKPGSEAATVVDASWLNSVQEELISVVEGAGLSPDRSNNGQLLEALKILVGTFLQVLPPEQTRNFFNTIFTSGALISPNKNAYIESTGTGVTRVQRFSVSVKNGDWVEFPDPFSGDDVQVFLQPATNAHQLNLFALNQDVNPSKNAKGFAVSSAVLMPGTGNQPFWLDNKITVDVLAIGPS